MLVVFLIDVKHLCYVSRIVTGSGKKLRFLVLANLKNGTFSSYTDTWVVAK